MKAMDNQTILAISLAMDKIEKRYPESYTNNAKWIKMKNLREECCVLMAQQQLDYHINRYERTKDEFSAKKIEEYKKYLSKYEKKENINNANRL